MHPLSAIAHLVASGDAFRELLDAMPSRRRRRHSAAVEIRGASGLVGSLAALLAAAHEERTLVVVTPEIRSARRLAQDLEALASHALAALGREPDGDGGEVLVLPPLEGDPYALIAPHDNVQRERVATLERLAEPPRTGSLRALVVPARSLLLPVPPATKAARSPLELEVGADVAPGEAVEELVRAGYVRVETIASWGEVAWRGAVLDVFPPDAEAPLRVEYWGDEITELRTFDPVTQRSTGALERARCGAVKEAAPDAAAAFAFVERVRERVRYDMTPPIVERMVGALESDASFPGFEILRWSVDEGVSPLALVPDALVAIDRPDQVDAELEQGRDALEKEWSEELRPFLPGPDDVFRDAGEIAREMAQAHLALPDVAWADGTSVATVDLGARPVSHHGGDVARWLRDLREHLEHGGSAGIVIASSGRLDRTCEVLRESGLDEALAWVQRIDGEAPPPVAPEATGPREGRVSLGPGLVSGGARIGQYLLHAEADIFGDVPAPRRERPRPKRAPTEAFKSDLRDLKAGDLVVHVDHGIGRFGGLVTIGSGEAANDFVEVVYAERDKLYLPLDRLDLIEKYSGVGGHAPRLDRLGGQTWEKVKRSVKKSMIDMTRELLELYAARQAARGFRFSEDGAWQEEFEAAFPHEETADQITAIADVKSDMQSERPMDRLVVGDVGFGKTEVALRAAFKAVMDGKQVAVLAPTTVLALQHHATFTRRTSSWPVRVELLSRFRSQAQVAQTRKGLESGEVDMVVGTHRLLSKDVKFRDLGLLVVDEEQRFGVRHKERIKSLRKEVDVLTLTATPIPRTLSMSLGGLRDMSVIETPPVNRHAIATHVLPFSQDVVAAACREEIDRGGQVYFVHDRVESIWSIANLVRELVPGAKVGVAHGQMPEGELEQQMIDFLRGETDVLVCTTVIENGLDIPRANTMIVNRADRFGLSQLYQLRGRVGRSDRQAHAFFFVPDRRELTADARRRLAALQEFTELGSGFRIAALDLEIRGAGNLLGGEQHGHIAAVGFDTYVRLLEETVQELRGEKKAPDFRARISLPLDLRLPADYVAEESQRLALYKRFSTRRTREEVEALVDEVRDRHGPPPPALDRLAEHAFLRVRAEGLRIETIEAGASAVRMRFARETKVHPQALVRVMQEVKGAAFSADGTLTVPIDADLPTLPQVKDLIAELG